MKPNLVFDLDGTLVDTSKRDHRLHEVAMHEQTLEPLSFSEYRNIRRGGANMADWLRVSTNGALDINRYFQTRMDLGETPEYLKLDEVFRGTVATLASCKLRYCNHIVSSRWTQASIEWQMNHLDLAQYFVSMRAVAGPKLSTLQGMGNLVGMVGDTEHDVVPAKTLGIKSVGLTTGIRSREYLLGLGADHVFDDISQLLGVL